MFYVFLNEFNDISSRAVRLVPVPLLFFYGATAQMRHRSPHYWGF